MPISPQGLQTVFSGSITTVGTAPVDVPLMSPLMPSDCVFVASLRVLGRDTGNGNSVTGSIEVRGKITAGVPLVEGTSLALVMSGAGVLGTCIAAFSIGTGASLKAQITGAPNRTISWSAWLRLYIGY